ncbi:conserved hypothetical protein [Candida tropicalis MYA-3404]|uniref:Uncharacterized protein n=1 Tax=Candida tropicalis (strain ATCC MYA-3404 / T1) TaxID=294747 RepID=C5MFC8_CANTT|nr:conserved hypothetical protein [Candida tropicalis MYA-3404]EER31988.1 conserved hypothetical protein [Candida tropicalis MYA-3404]KAG4405577.1 hypothetical protein JTP64_005613 [Candida tropicalis]
MKNEKKKFQPLNELSSTDSQTMFGLRLPRKSPTGVLISLRPSSVSNLSIQRSISLLTKQPATIHAPRSLRLTRSMMKVTYLKTSNLGTAKYIIQALTGIYCGIVIVSLLSFYILYQDANDRQFIPFWDTSIDDKLNSVLAINKDEVCESPRHATKHYRRLLIELAKQEYPDLNEDQFDNRFNVPILSKDFLIQEKTPKFINFYIDMILRYCKCLLSKGEVEVSIGLLSKIVNDDFLFYKVGDAEKLSSSSRILAKITNDPEQSIPILTRTIDMLVQNHPNSMKIDDNYILDANSKISDELINCLNDLASNFAKLSKSKRISKKQKSDLLSKSLQIYLSELRSLQDINKSIELGKANQASYPLFNCERANLTTMINTIKAHISEVMWAKGYKDNAIDWSEQILNDLYMDRYSDARIGPILLNVLNNLELMYGNMKQPQEIERIKQLKHDVRIYDIRNKFENISWYDKTIKKMSKVIYAKTPLGLIERSLKGRFDPNQRIQNLEEFEDEDDESIFAIK